ncbi:nuclear transport factor 2 family protein [Actinophytocola algeriensis]|uniref:Ketosteroid isomerase-like protein n=1 Tax=Actinophytocola algeriensis TaxID=1768010 RepID=A0A7W7PZZ8_9PSEU|nr:nuclear transport factor 2 family protein [Actinophytocola algeriensis]MBB4904449.1 ketosteroid isomerase-like protein [Actinophytocola algeriensis]MBE1476692.1 ketosteroid isomerase-like protein [Actinophytocola algeriensis]
MPPEPAEVATQFNDAINAGDLAGLAVLMSDDHRFVDAASNVVSGKPACLAAWRGFFESFPDYQNVFTAFFTRGDVVMIVGRSECSEPALAGPALWTATVIGDQVTEWHVHEDAPEVREHLGLPAK